MNTMTEETAGRIYDILVRVCGAPSHPHFRESFVLHQTHESFPSEYRFQGKLGFGGKFWRTGERMYVTCYREDETPERLEMMSEADAELKLFYLKPA